MDDPTSLDADQHVLAVDGDLARRLRTLRNALRIRHALALPS